jgi:hypothetical protein
MSIEPRMSADSRRLKEKAYPRQPVFIRGLKVKSSLKNRKP